MELVMKVAFMTLGCKANSYETGRMIKLFEEAGHEVVPFEGPADIYIVNTCTVTNIADRKSRQMLHKARKINPGAVVVAAGCYVNSASMRGEKDGSVDIFIQNKDKPHILDIVSNAVKNMGKNIINTQNHDIIQCNSNGYERCGQNQGHTRAYIKIQDGCCQYCTYCIIPYVRGGLVSRSMESVCEEARELAGRGYKEIVLTGIHISSYGASGNDAEFYLKLGGKPLAGLLKALSGIEGIERIRLGSLEPRIITGNFVEELAGIPGLCPHFHLSLQSGCDAVLKRMNRHYTTEEYLECLRVLRRHFTNPAITTDIITGFPQETEEEFEETCRFVRKAGFAQIHVFKYSRRQGTIADKMEGQNIESVKTERSRKLIDIGQELALKYQKQAAGRYEYVLFEEAEEINHQKYITGYNERYIRIAVPESRTNNPQELCNTIKRVHILGNLSGEILIADL